MSTQMPVGCYIQINCDVIYYQDNDTTRGVVNEGTKSYDKKRKFICNQINNCNQYLVDSANCAVCVRKETSLMVSDILTKSLDKRTQEQHNLKLRGVVEHSLDYKMIL